MTSRHANSPPSQGPKSPGYRVGTEGHGQRPGRWFGVDFSGDRGQWGPGCSKSIVWIAEVVGSPGSLTLCHVMRVRELHRPENQPFDRLAAFLDAEDYDAAAVDAPFSVPAHFVPEGSHAQLLALVSHIKRTSNHRFPDQTSFFRAVTGCEPPLDPPKPLRQTELSWDDRNVNVRSTLWTGPRSGAAMTSACLMLLSRLHVGIWPWASTEGRPLVVEAFPAAQLKQWGLPHERYSVDKDPWGTRRRCIVDKLKERIEIPSRVEDEIVASADALDATLSAFAAVAVTMGKVASAPQDAALLEGWIAVHA